MEQSLATILAALTGAIAATSVSLLTHSLQKRRDEIKWRNDRKADAYAAAIRYLLRLWNKRSVIDPDGRTSRKHEEVKEIFEEISNFQYELNLAVIYSGYKYKGTLNDIKSLVDDSIRKIVNNGNDTEWIESLPKIYGDLANAFRRDAN